MSSSPLSTGCPGSTTSGSWDQLATDHRPSSNRYTVSSNSPALSRRDSTEGPSPSGDGFGRHKRAWSAEADFRSRLDHRLSAATLRRFRSLRDLLKASPKGEGFHASPMGTLKLSPENPGWFNSETMAIDFEAAKVKLTELIEWANANDKALTRNEAATRMHLIDFLLIECLGWPKGECSPEDRFAGTYTDYSLGSVAKKCVIEAKREAFISNCQPDSTNARMP